MQAISIGSLHRLCTSRRWRVLRRTGYSSWVPLRWMPLCLNMLDMFRPGVDQRAIFASAGDVPADVASDGPRPHQANALAHTIPPLPDHSPAVQAMPYSRL